MGITVINKYKAAVVQAEPGWFDLELSVRKTIHWIDEAGKAGCKLIAFPEMWIPGYPYWLWSVNYSESLPLIKRYRENCLPAGSEGMRRIRAAARDNGIFVSLGFSEIDLATCFISQVIISPTGDVINHRRKIKPSHVEKLIFGDGSGDTFETVMETEIGRLGQFNCWENTNPFLRAYAISKGEQVHVAAWPLYTGATTYASRSPWVTNAEATELETRSYALEVGAYTLAPYQIISAEGVKKNTPEGQPEEKNWDHYNGHARAFGPGGSIIIEKPAKNFEGLVFVDIDLAETHLPKALMDFGGHYMRPDLIRLLVDTGRKELITEADGDGKIVVTRTIDRVGLSKPLDSPRKGLEAVTKESVYGPEA